MSRDPVSPPRPPASELASRRERLLSRLPADALVVLRGARPGREMRRFRQSNEFYYLTGLTVPGAYALLDPRAARTSVYVPHRDAAARTERRPVARRRGSRRDPRAHRRRLGRGARDGSRSTWPRCSSSRRAPPTRPSPPPKASRRAAIRRLASLAWAANDPFGSDSSPEAGLAQALHAHFPQCEVRDLSPALDELRLHKSAHELELMRARRTHLRRGDDRGDAIDRSGRARARARGGCELRVSPERSYRPRVRGDHRGRSECLVRPLQRE